MNESAPNTEPEAFKIAVILHHNLEPWQRLNVAAFTISGVAARPGVVGEIYKDASGRTYLPMFNEPVMVFGADHSELARTADRAALRHVPFSILPKRSSRHLTTSIIALPLPPSQQATFRSLAWR